MRGRRESAASLHPQGEVAAILCQEQETRFRLGHLGRQSADRREKFVEAERRCHQGG
jgi:hypothetical protein